MKVMLFIHREMLFVALVVCCCELQVGVGWTVHLFLMSLNLKGSVHQLHDLGASFTALFSTLLSLCPKSIFAETTWISKRWDSHVNKYKILNNINKMLNSGHIDLRSGAVTIILWYHSFDKIKQIQVNDYRIVRDNINI